MVKYNDIKTKLKSGYVVAYSNNDLGAKIIKFATGSKYSHVGVVWIIGRHIMVLESTLNNGVDIRPIDTSNFYWISTNVAWNDTYEAIATSKLETAYSLIDAITAGFGLRPSKSGEICSFLVDDVLGLPRTIGTPRDVVKFFTDNKFKVTEVVI